MAPTLASRDDEVDFPGPEITSIAVIVAVVVISLAMAAFLVACLFKRRKTQRYEQAANPNHSMTKIEQTKRRKKTEYTRIYHNEPQQQSIISEPLTAREPARSVGRLSRVSEEDEGDLGTSARIGGLRRDWKEWEARIQQERSISLESHPGLDQTFRISGDVPRPTLSRGPSPIRYDSTPYTNEVAISPISPILSKGDNQRPQW